jgi:transcriptional regulator with XRE-family HTH domain
MLFVKIFSILEMCIVFTFGNFIIIREVVIMTFGQKLKILRTNANYTQEQLARKIDVTKSNISKYESNNLEPNIKTLAAISDIFGVPTDYLLGTGVFEKWDNLVANREPIIKEISSSLRRLSGIVLSGMDDITFIKFIYAFNIDLTDNGDGTYGITTIDPIPNYSSNSFFPDATVLSQEEEKLICTYRCLSEEERAIVYGKALDLKHSSVAADQSKRKASGK